MQILLWSQVQLMLSLAASLEARPRLGLIFFCWSKPLLFVIQERKQNKTSQTEKGRDQQNSRWKKGKGFRGCRLGGVGAVWVEPAARLKKRRQLTVGREAEGRADHSFLKACLYMWLAITFAFAKPRSLHSSSSLAASLRRLQSSAISVCGWDPWGFTKPHLLIFFQKHLFTPNICMCKFQ